MARRKRRRGRKKRLTIIVTALSIYVLVSFTAVVALLAYDAQARKKHGDAYQPSKIVETTNKVIEGFESGNILIEILPLREPKEEQIPEEPEEVVDDSPKPDGCIIWPIKNLEIYSQVPGEGQTGPKSDLVIGKAVSPEAYEVIKEQDGYFLVDANGTEGYIDSGYCMINLPDYLGEELVYDITNSYSSIFMAHDYKLYGITGTVIPGFEDVKISEYEYLVPYLYPCSQKLHTVAQKVMEDGYKLKIYEAFRPYVATRFLYDTTQTFLNNPVPEKDAEGNEIVEYDEEGNVILPLGEFPPVGSIVGYDGGIYTIDFSQLLVPPETVATPFPPGTIVGENGLALDQAGNQLGIITINGGVGTQTYANVITGGRYNLGAFLAAKSSAHNKGIALDLTLCDINTGEDLPMQTQIHDLSYHSVLAQNNENAKLLARYMKSGGFNDLSSEWWHFQDDETKSKLNINFVVNDGVKLP